MLVRARLAHGHGTDKGVGGVKRSDINILIMGDVDGWNHNYIRCLEDTVWEAKSARWWRSEDFYSVYVLTFVLLISKVFLMSGFYCSLDIERT